MAMTSDEVAWARRIGKRIKIADNSREPCWNGDTGNFLTMRRSVRKMSAANSMGIKLIARNNP